MSFLRKPMKIFADLLMLFVLIGSVGNLWLLALPNPMVPDGPEDLGFVRVTVRSLYKPISKGKYILLSEEYPTKFLLSTYPLAPDSMESLVRAGRKVSLQIKKESTSDLQNIGLIYAYSLTLENGDKVFDTSNMVPQHTSLTSFDCGNVFFYGMIAIAVLYFLARIYFYLKRRSSFK